MSKIKQLLLTKYENSTRDKLLEDVISIASKLRYWRQDSPEFEEASNQLDNIEDEMCRRKLNRWYTNAASC